MLIIEAIRRRYLAVALASAWALVPALASNGPGLHAAEGGPDLFEPGGHEAFDEAAGWQVLSAAKLDRVRGGFDLPDLQLKLSFGFDQAVFVNGELVARTVLTIDQLRSSVTSEMEAIRSQMNPAAMSAEIQSQVAQQLAAAGIQATVALPTEVAQTPAVANPTPVATNQTPMTTSPASGASTPAPVQAATTPPALATPVAVATPPVASSATQAPNAGTAVASSPVAIAAPVAVASPPVVTTQPAASTGVASTVPVVGVNVPVSSSPATAPVAQGTVAQRAPPLPPASTGVLQPAPLVAASPPAAVSATAPASPPATNPVASTSVGAGTPTPATPAASVAAGNGQSLVPSVATAPASTKAAPAAQQPATTTVTSSQSGSVTTVVNNSSFTPVLVIQNGGGNTVGSSAASSPANAPISTVVQNSLDDQRIQVLTEISASANSIEIMRAMNLGSSIREGLINSLRR